MLLGHLVQVLHFLLFIAVAYLLTRTNNWWIGPVSLGFIVIASLITGGMCPLTMLSNVLLGGAGGKEYIDLAHWLESFIGTPANHIFYVFSFVISLVAGFLVRRKMEYRG